MLFNATLLRLDPPPGGSPGPLISARCVVTEPSAAQALTATLNGVPLTKVAYLRTALLPSGVVAEVGAAAILRIDGIDDPASLLIKRVIPRTGRLGHAELWLAPEGLTVTTCPCTGGGA
jgi:hypothetical protein